MTDYSQLVMFVAGLACGYGLDRFRRFLDTWAERQQPQEMDWSGPAVDQFGGDTP